MYTIVSGPRIEKKAFPDCTSLPSSVILSFDFHLWSYNAMLILCLLMHFLLFTTLSMHICSCLHASHDNILCDGRFPALGYMPCHAQKRQVNPCINYELLFWKIQWAFASNPVKNFSLIWKPKILFLHGTCMDPPLKVDLISSWFVAEDPPSIHCETNMVLA